MSSWGPRQGESQATGLGAVGSCAQSVPGRTELGDSDVPCSGRKPTGPRVHWVDWPGSLCAASQVYKGYVDDPRNTDNAWIETVAISIHFPDQSSVELKRLNSVRAGLGWEAPGRGQCRAWWEGPAALLGQGQGWPGTLRWGPPGARSLRQGWPVYTPLWDTVP